MSTQTQTAAAPDPTAFFDSMREFTGSLEKTLGHSLKPLKEVAEKMGGSKFGKNVKKFGSALKGMAGASINAWAMAQLMKLIEPFLKLLKLFELPIDVLSGLLSMFVYEIFVQLLPYFLDFSKILFDLMPIFKFLGKIVGVVLVWALNFLMKRLKIMVKIFTEIFQFLAAKFLPIWKKISAFFKPFTEFLGKTFKPLWEGIKTAFMALKEAWNNSGGKMFGKDGFIARGLRALFNAVKSIINGILGSINNIINSINDALDSNLPTIPLLARGGMTTGPTLAMLGDNPSRKEVVVPLERAGEFGFGKDPALLSEMEEQNRLLRLIVKQNREASRWQL